MEALWIFIVLTLLGLALYVLQIVAVRRTVGRYPMRACHSAALEPNDEYERWYPPLSILKPLKGLDDNLFDNLESFCLQDYPKYEVIFSLQSHNDPAYRVAWKIKNKYPDKDIFIIVERCSAGLNPKVNNLIPAYRTSRHEYILISDSNVLVGKDYLRHIASAMRNPAVGLVSNIIRGVGGKTLGSVFENLHLNSFVVGSVCFLDRFLHMPCVVGKSMLLRKTDLELIGGLNAVKDVLAEDYILGKKMQKKGKKVILSNYLINNVNDYWGLRKFLNRHTRWGKLRWKIGGIMYLSELIFNPVFMSAIPLLLCTPTRATVLFALLVGLIKVLGDSLIGRRMQAGIHPILYFLSPLKDILIGFLWLVPIVSNTVSWRGNRYIIGKDSQLSQCRESRFMSLRYRFFDAVRAKLA